MLWKQPIGRQRICDWAPDIQKLFRGPASLGEAHGTIIYHRGGRDYELERTKKQLLKDPEFIKEFDALETEYKLAATLIRLRLARGLTQEDLAKLLNTKQESIARLESGGSLPSLSTMKKIADALGADLEINLRPKQVI
jgi:DNA-binding XRE family transcriptional regulator